MGGLVFFCAGADGGNLPGRHINAILFNVPNNAATEAGIVKTTRLIQQTTPRYVMLDSGGFQYHEQERKGLPFTLKENHPVWSSEVLNLTPDIVVRAAARLGPNIMVGLDYPIRTMDEKDEQEKEFRKKLGFNADWAIETAMLRQRYCPEIRLFIPIQCYNLDHLERFMRLILGIPYDGVSMPCRNLKPDGILEFMIDFHRRGIRQVHLLGVASFFSIAVAAFMARHFFDWVSLDATTWSIHAKNSKYMNHLDLSAEYLGDDAIISGSVLNDCLCPYCSGISFTAIKNMPYKDRYLHLCCHNFWAIEHVCREMFNHSQSVGLLKRHLTSVCDNAIDIEHLCRHLARAEAKMKWRTREQEVMTMRT